MYCQKCGNHSDPDAKYCGGCGVQMNKKTNPFLLTAVIFFSLIASGVLYFVGLEYIAGQEIKETPVEIAVKKDDKEQESNTKIETTAIKEETIQEKVIVQSQSEDREVADIIEDAQTRVYTIFSDYGQGSGFLINEQGDIMTNAHVVEGSIYVTVKDHAGTEFDGQLIGYSNEIDLAVIRVPSLAGKTPLPLELNEKSALGDEVIALGSPHGYENTATLGNISGVDRTFSIDPHYYENIYQISAPIAPGSSGGPLLDQTTEKVVGINSARHGEEATIGFSIPIFKITHLMNDWVANPMHEDAIYDLFYNQYGNYFYDDLYSGDYYFDGGDYEDTEEYYYYDAYTDTYYFYDPYAGEFYYYDEELGDFYYYDGGYEYEDWYYEDSYDDEYYSDEEYYEYEDEYYNDEEYYEYEDEYYSEEEYYEYEDEYDSDDEYYDYEEESYFDEETDSETEEIYNGSSIEEDAELNDEEADNDTPDADISEGA
ncbi:trypsin-like peptidase domain-containing protein [Jeotgalibacillus malaysiensis]|uniref:trypsin-like peptidase domain-containing protein n=1 Tax=Jeotgalibacillus malaysiensis TaxID=1508404 RepID=UPI00384B8A56